MHCYHANVASPPFPLHTHAGPTASPNAKALQPLSGVMESNEEVALLMGASLSRLRCGEKAAPWPVPAALHRSTAGNRVPGQDGTRRRGPKRGKTGSKLRISFLLSSSSSPRFP